MISQSLYFDLITSALDPDVRYSRSLRTVSNNHYAELKRFIKPYVFAIHQPSGRGFYLDREYRHILDVKDCQEPVNPVKIARHRLPESGDLPAWVLEELDATDDDTCYNSFWLYVDNPLSHGRGA